MTTIRFATDADIPSLVEFGRDIHARSRYAWLPYSAKSAWTYLEQVLPRKQYCVMVAMREDSVSGILLASTQPYPFSQDCAAQIELLYVVPQQRGGTLAMQMLGAFRRWANNRDVVEIWLIDRFGGNENYNRRLFARLGMQSPGGLFTQWVDRG